MAGTDISDLHPESIDSISLILQLAISDDVFIDKISLKIDFKTFNFHKYLKKI